MTVIAAEHIPVEAVKAVYPRIDGAELWTMLQNPGGCINQLLPLMWPAFAENSEWSTFTCSQGEGMVAHCEIGPYAYIEMIKISDQEPEYVVSVPDQALQADYFVHYRPHVDDEQPRVAMRYWQNGAWRYDRHPDIYDTMSAIASAGGIVSKDFLLRQQ